jgi:AcrR family transcriptional regulator
MTSPPVPAIPASPRPQRADARRNRERILKAARTVFAEQGAEAQIDDVARRAKVGVGTVYRHFPTKEALIDAIVQEAFEEIAGFAREALERDDPWDGFCELVWRSAERNAADRAFCEVVAMSDKRSVVDQCGLGRMTELLIQGACAQGKMRADATPDDVPIMMSALGSVMRSSPTPTAWRRYLTLMLDGMRAT